MPTPLPPTFPPRTSAHRSRTSAHRSSQLASAHIICASLSCFHGPQRPRRALHGPKPTQAMHTLLVARSEGSWRSSSWAAPPFTVFLSFAVILSYETDRCNKQPLRLLASNPATSEPQSWAVSRSVLSTDADSAQDGAAPLKNSSGEDQPTGA